MAVVGTRNATAAGCELARAVVAELVGAGYTVFSELALGIDGRAGTHVFEEPAQVPAIVRSLTALDAPLVALPARAARA